MCVLPHAESNCLVEPTSDGGVNIYPRLWIRASESRASESSLSESS
jgi:hypothetical protein